MGALEVTGDGVPDLIFVDKNRDIRYYSVVNGTTGVIVAIETAKQKRG